ncbi:MAG: hypothetical protein Q9173_006805 [Seirophora scorigena]
MAMKTSTTSSTPQSATTAPSAPRNNFAAGKDTCCDQHQGVTGIDYHNEAVIPPAAASMSGLSSGAKAGVAAFFQMRRRKPKNDTDAQPNHLEYHQEYHQEYNQGYKGMSPLDESVMYGFKQELPAPPARMEVDADPHHLLQRHEMHGHERGVAELHGHKHGVVELPEHNRRVREMPG